MNDRHLSSAEAAKRLGTTAKALRLYEERGLVAPIRSEAGWRGYGPAQIARLHQILALKRFGLSLSDISELLTGSVDKLSAVLALRNAF
jgi:DNA-binding transcriptional MerR regulator